MKRTYGRNTKHTRLTLGESKELRKLAKNVDTLAQVPCTHGCRLNCTGLNEKEFQAVLFELGLDLTKMLTLLENKIDGQKLSVAGVSSGCPVGVAYPKGAKHTWNSFEWVNTSTWEHLEVSQIQFDTENGNSY